jgi:outer membrane protein assembly factor BamA
VKRALVVAAFALLASSISACGGAARTAPVAAASTESTCACTNDLDGKVISAIEVHGTDRIEKKQILDYLRTKVGRVYRRCMLDRDVTELMNAGLFEMASADAHREGTTIKVDVYVHELAVVRGSKVDDTVGGAMPSVDAITDALVLHHDTIFSAYLLEESSRRLEDAFAKVGRKVKIVAVVTFDGVGVDIVFKVY